MGNNKVSKIVGMPSFINFNLKFKVTCKTGTFRRKKKKIQNCSHDKILYLSHQNALSKLPILVLESTSLDEETRTTTTKIRENSNYVWGNGTACTP